MSTTVLLRPGLTRLATGIRAAVARPGTVEETARRVAAALQENLPTADILLPEERVGSPENYVQHVLHVEPGFSIVALVWQPGQRTAVHDHISWCAFGVVQGTEYEIVYRLEDGYLVPIAAAANRTGEVSGFAPPGDIHQVHNSGDTTAISIHVYGADIAKLGSSVRRRYDLPVRA
ncbi:cysteine dioxygenase family protein [Rhizohabitans arisaemae]|uniref:cysteine dioxygenase family protein n=1 Tax=Rhizohabitans arisaemae TaxID=2720610 RepID=UPI0024B0768E|nr:cysteine dioxygenase family protein [Rhizohabitans arisaemae]